MNRTTSDHTRQSLPTDERRNDRGGSGNQRDDRGGSGNQRDDRGGSGNQRDDRGGSGNQRAERTTALHRTVGNQAVKSAASEGESPERPAASSSQPTLALTDETDASEREATRVADRVMRARTRTTPVSPARKPSTDSGRDSGILDDETAAEIDAATAGGTALPGPVRSDFESRFGRDLSSVRVHTGSRADAAARSIDAAAFTLGDDIAFASGNYDPDSQQGKRLLAHELTHVVQQTGGGRAQRRPAAGTGTPLPVQRRLPDNVSGYSMRDAERANASQTEMDREEVVGRLVDAGVEENVARSIISTASNVETVLGTAVDVGALFGLEAGAAVQVTGGLTFWGTASALLSISGPILFGLGAMVAWANALETSETMAAVTSGAYATVAIAKGENVPVLPPTEEKDYSQYVDSWTSAAHRVENEYRNMLGGDTEEARDLLLAFTGLRENDEHVVLNQLYQQAVEEELSGVAREMASRQYLLWPAATYGVKFLGEEHIERLLEDE